MSPLVSPLPASLFSEDAPSLKLCWPQGKEPAMPFGTSVPCPSLEPTESGCGLLGGGGHAPVVLTTGTTMENIFFNIYASIGLKKVTLGFPWTEQVFSMLHTFHVADCTIITNFTKSLNFASNSKT